MRKHGALNRRLDGTGGDHNPHFLKKVDKQRSKNKMAKKSRKGNR